MPDAATVAYEALHAQILRGDLPPGAFLVESELAAEIGVSRTPVREAIRRLAAVGLVKTAGRRRAIVRDFPESRADELFELRARLEGYAAYRAATQMSVAQLERLRSLATAMEQATQRPGETGVAEFAALNDEFHQTILTAAACEPLTAALEPALQVQLVLLQRYRQTLHEHLERSCWHHREIIRAIEARDAELAEAQMRLHLLSARGGTPGRKASDRGARHSASVSALRGRAASQRKRAASKHRA